MWVVVLVNSILQCIVRERPCCFLECSSVVIERIEALGRGMVFPVWRQCVCCVW